MHREFREGFPRHRLQRNRLLAIPACITTRASRTCRDACRDRKTRDGRENVPGIPGACASRNFMHLVRDPLTVRILYLMASHTTNCPDKIWSTTDSQYSMPSARPTKEISMKFQFRLKCICLNLPVHLSDRQDILLCCHGMWKFLCESIEFWIRSNSPISQWYFLAVSSLNSVN